MAELDYDHGFHAGNHGDVWKHVALLAVLASVRRGRVAVVDTHGGQGHHPLRATGEWTAGVGRLLDAFPTGSSTGSPAVDRYLSRLRRVAPDLPRAYPGSPRLVLDALGPTGRLRVHEIQEPVLAKLRAATTGDGRCQVVGGDGLAALTELPEADDVVVFVDPPFVAKDEWNAAADAVAGVWARRPEVLQLLWYPVKRFTRPDSLQARLRDAGVPFVALDLVVSPIEVERRALAGSGVLLVNCPESALVEIHGAAPVLGRRLATHDGRWSLRAQAAGARIPA
jgi:23S rRNA (adenine2030-N6)-methyltransferase